MNNKKNVAIIGAGISGLSMAYILKHNQINFTLFEKEERIGGHAKTIFANIHNVYNTTAIDIGFIVFNKQTYPNLLKLFKLLNVEVQKAQMSFGVSININNSTLEYSGKNFFSLFAQYKNLFNLNFYKMLADIVKFNYLAKKHFNTLPINITLSDYIKSQNLGSWFVNYYLLPIGAAIWSTKANNITNFPAKSFLNFFNNHSLLNTFKKHQWYSVKGGSINYVNKLIEPFKNSIITNSHVNSIIRKNNKIELTVNNKLYTFDDIIFACSATEAIKILNLQATDDEKNILQNITYKNNSIMVHTNTNCMPANKKAWSAWNYKETTNKDLGLVYWVNVLQNAPVSSNIFISLNNTENIQNNILHLDNFSHPQFTLNALKAQANLKIIQGKNNTWFIGSYWYYGFHEDGILSAVNLAKQLNLNIPW